jgi:hypothetical protein
MVSQPVMQVIGAPFRPGVPSPVESHEQKDGSL